MQWYENMTKEQRTKFKKVIAVSIVGIIYCANSNVFSEFFLKTT